MMTQAQALGDIRYDKVKLTSKPKVKTACDPPRWPVCWNSRYIGCLFLGLHMTKTYTEGVSGNNLSLENIFGIIIIQVKLKK